MREQPFDSDWRFHLAEAGQASDPGFNDANWRALDLPHDWSIELERRADCPSADQGGYFVDGVGWYRKRFTAPEEWCGKRVAVEFEGVYRDAEVWINGHYLGRHPYGYSSFLVDLTRFLQIGDSGNVVAVRVDNSTHRHTRWYSGSGIYRHVRLIVTNPVRVAHWGVVVATPEVSADSAAIRVATVVENTLDQEAHATLRWCIRGPDGEEVAVAGAAGTVAACASQELNRDIQVSAPRLWSVDTPQLYTLETELRVGPEAVDSVSTTFGVRTFHFDPERGLVLNGEGVLLRGGCVHHDCGPLGAASVDRAEERKVELLKASGFNAIRCAHNPPAPAFLDACDRLGMLVIDEAFDVWRARKLAYDYHLHFDEWWQRDLDSMLYRDRNHPSIILWSIGNELVERALPEGAKIARMLADRVREVDPTRPVTAGICDIWGEHGEWSQTDGLFDVLDVCGYNYRVDVYEPDHERRPERIIAATESFPPDAYDYWKAVERLPYVVGDFVWTSMDYLGEAGIGHTYFEGEPGGQLPGWPWNQANCGDIDLCGLKRPQSHYRDVLWGRAEQPYIAVHPPLPEGKQVVVSRWGWYDVQPSWTWPVQEGDELRVDVYFSCDEIELQLNGRSLGRQPATEASKHIAAFTVPYEPGELKAIAYGDGQAVATSSLTTAGCGERIRLRVDRDPIRADRNDLAYVTVEVVDSADRAVPTATDMVSFTIQGPGHIAAVASSDPKNTEPYRGNSHSVWRGRALVVVQPTGEPGHVVLRAQADRLDAGEVSIHVE